MKQSAIEMIKQSITEQEIIKDFEWIISFHKNEIQNSFLHLKDYIRLTKGVFKNQYVVLDNWIIDQFYNNIQERINLYERKLEDIVSTGEPLPFLESRYNSALQDIKDFKSMLEITKKDGRVQ